MASSHEDSDDFEEDGNDTTLANNCIVILVKFLDETYGVVTMSSLVKPKFPDQLPFDDCITLLQKWIKDKTPCSIRWDIEQEIWNLFNYAACKDFDISQHVLKPCALVYYSCDIAEVKDERDRVIVEAHRGQTLSHQAKKRLRYPTQPAPSIKAVTASKPSSTSKKRSYDALKLENEKLRQKVTKLTSDVDELASENHEKRNRIQELEDSIEEMKKQTPESLSDNLRESVLDLKKILADLKRPDSHPSFLTPSSSSSSGRSTPACSTPCTTPTGPAMELLYKDIYILKTVSLKAKTAIRADGNQQKSLNNAVAELLESMYTTTQMANMSMSGNACPSIPGAVAKLKFPEDIVEAIRSWVIVQWDKAYPGSVLTKSQVRAAIRFSLAAAHAKEKGAAKKKKVPNGGAGDGAENPNASNASDSD